MTKILMIILGIIMIVSAVCYNPIRRKTAGVIGVGGSYFFLLGVVLLINFGQVVEEMKDRKVMMIIPILFILAAFGYIILAMITRCNSVAQRIFLPFAACLIGFGFAWRLLGAIVLHIPMESGKAEKTSAFPNSVYSPDGENFTLENDSGDNATYYCTRTGQRAHFRDVDFEDGGCPTGWRRA